MEKYLLTVDSAERDTTTYEEPNDYTVTLNTPLYNITKIELVSARVPLSQYLVDSHSNVVTVDSVDYYIKNGNYTGTELAAQLKTNLSASVINNVSYDDDTQKLEFNGTTQFTMSFENSTNMSEIMGFVHGVTYTSDAGGALVAPGVVNLFWPNFINLSLKGNSEEYIDNKVYLETPHEALNFFGTMVAHSDGDYINFDRMSDKIERNFIEKPIPFLDRLTVQFLFNNFDTVIPYDFKLRNHFLKFEITCSLDKLVVTKENADIKKMIEIPPKLDLERFRDPWRPWADKRVLMYGGAILVFILVLLLMPGQLRT